MATLSALIGNAAAIREAARNRVGYVNDTTLLPDATVDEALRAGTRKINSMRPLINVASFQTVDGQQSYTPSPAGLVQILRAWWPNEASCALVLDDMERFLSAPIDELGTRPALDPAAVEIARRRSRNLRAMVGGRAVVREIGGTWTVYLTPVPGNVGTVFFSYSSARYASAGDVDEQDEEAFWLVVEGHLHRLLAAGAGGVERLRDTAENSEVVLASPRHHLALAMDAERRLRRQWAPPRIDHVFP